jgi:selenocysteine lyase/cysteine desulfurase
LEEILETGVGAIRSKERGLTSRFIEGCREISAVRLHGAGDADRSVAVVSIDVPEMDSGTLALGLFEKYGIITRSGLHCAPCAHLAAGTFPGGTVRFSFGRETTPDEIDTALKALRSICI